MPDLEPELSSVPQMAAAIVAQAVDLGRVYWDSDGFGERPSEDEMIVHYDAPLLRALGWAAENIAVKWRDINICVFRRLPRVPENMALLIEAKRLGQGVEAALQQAKGYAAVQRVSCDLMVTDGFRYRLYSPDYS